jgi:hypothetical protein
MYSFLVFSHLVLCISSVSHFSLTSRVSFLAITFLAFLAFFFRYLHLIQVHQDQRADQRIKYDFLFSSFFLSGFIYFYIYFLLVIFCIQRMLHAYYKVDGGMGSKRKKDKRDSGLSKWFEVGKW